MEFMEEENMANGLKRGCNKPVRNEMLTNHCLLRILNGTFILSYQINSCVACFYGLLEATWLDR